MSVSSLMITAVLFILGSGGPDLLASPITSEDDPIGCSTEFTSTGEKPVVGEFEVNPPVPDETPIPAEEPRKEATLPEPQTLPEPYNPPLAEVTADSEKNHAG